MYLGYFYYIKVSLWHAGGGEKKGSCISSRRSRRRTLSCNKYIIIRFLRQNSPISVLLSQRINKLCFARAPWTEKILLSKNLWSVSKENVHPTRLSTQMGCRPSRRITKLVCIFFTYRRMRMYLLQLPVEGASAENREKPCSARLPIVCFLLVWNFKSIFVTFVWHGLFNFILLFLCGETTFLTVWADSRKTVGFLHIYGLLSKTM